MFSLVIAQLIAGPPKKRCYQCGKEKPHREFRHTSLNEERGRCIDCLNESVRKRARIRNKTGPFKRRK